MNRWSVGCLRSIDCYTDRAAVDYGLGMLRTTPVVSLLAVLLFVGGCATGDPVVPKAISTMVNEQGRERTYDLAWQDIRRFEGALMRGETSDFSAQALLILSRMNRLAEGKAGGLSDMSSRDTLDQAKDEASLLDQLQIRHILREHAALVRESFDAGDFDSAQRHALEALGAARAFEAGGG